MSEYGPLAPSPLDRIAQDAAAAAAHSAEAVQLGQQSYNRDVVIGHAIGATHEAVQAGRSANLQGFADTAAGIGEVRTDVAGVGARVGELGEAVGDLGRVVGEGDRETHRRLGGLGMTIETGNTTTHGLLAGIGEGVAELTKTLRGPEPPSEEERAARAAVAQAAYLEQAEEARSRLTDRYRLAPPPPPLPSKTETTPVPPSGLGYRVSRLMPQAVGGRMVAWGGRQGGVIGALSRGAGHTIRGGAGAITGTFNWLRSQTGITDPAGRTGKRRVHLLGRRERIHPYN